MVDRIEAFEIDWDGGEVEDDVIVNKAFVALSRGQRVAQTIRAVVESMLEHHFGKNIINDLFQRYADLVEDHLSKNNTKYVNLVISLVKNNS